MAQKHASLISPRKTNGFDKIVWLWGIKNRSKIDQNRIIHEASKTTPKNVTKGAQLDPKNGPGWGHVELQNRLGRGEERR